MGGSNTDYGQGNGQSAADPIASMPVRQQQQAPQGQMFGKMDAWNVESSHPEQIAQGFAKGIESGVGIGMAKSSKDKKPKGKGKGQGKQLIDEYGYPYSLDESGNPVYEVGSVQVS